SAFSRTTPGRSRRSRDSESPSLNRCPSDKAMLRRTFLAASTGAAAAASVPAFELDEIAISQLAEGLKSGRWTTRRLTELYLQRIETLDRQGPQLRAVIEVNPDALADAERLDRERRSGANKSPLHGIPIILKDNIDTAGRMSTSAGSLA